MLVGVLWCVVHGVWIMPLVRSLTPLLDMVTTCGPVDLERNFAPLGSTLSLTRLFFWFHLTASAVLLIGSVSEASDLHLNSLLALAAGLLFSCADGCDCNRRAASSTSCNIQYTRFGDVPEKCNCGHGELPRGEERSIWGNCVFQRNVAQTHSWG